jgi:hypothetical protein
MIDFLLMPHVVSLIYSSTFGIVSLTNTIGSIGFARTSADEHRVSSSNVTESTIDGRA